MAHRRKPHNGPAANGNKNRPTPGRRERSAARVAAERRSRIMTTVVVVAVLAVVGVVGGIAVKRSTAAVAGTSTKPTAWSLPALNGSARIHLADFRGKPTVVNFFASWCTACDLELPGFANVSGQLKGQVNFVGVDALETGDRNYMPKRHHITWWPLARDVGGSNSSGLHDALGGGNSMPLTAFYDANGKLLDVERSALPEQTLKQKISSLYGVQIS